MEKIDEHWNIIDRFIHKHLSGVRNISLGTDENPQDGLGDFDKPLEPYRQNPPRFNSLGSRRIGFTGSVETYKIVRDAVRKSGLEYEFCYLGTKISSRYGIVNVEG